VYNLLMLQTYQATRTRIMSRLNQYYFEGTELKGMGSPHTPHRNIWPLATAVEALTANNTGRKVELLKVG
jgi:meiotically up-regulated gene 157 (Mug157) protein